MSSFRDQPFARRFAAMGDEAEKVFEETYPEGFVRYGINRPPINLTNVPPKLRYSPDYLTAKGLVEVQGFGADRVFKLKLDKLDALWDWHEDFRVDVFVWNKADATFGWVRLPELDDAINEFGEEREFPEGKAYWALSVHELPVIEWVEHVPC